jgi:hypothetical protein
MRVATWPKNRAAAIGGKILRHLKPATVGIPGDSAHVGPLQKVTRLITLVRSEVDVLQAGPMPAAECPTKNGGFRCVQGLCRSPQTVLPVRTAVSSALTAYGPRLTECCGTRQRLLLAVSSPHAAMDCPGGFERLFQSRTTLKPRRPTRRCL